MDEGGAAPDLEAGRLLFAQPSNFMLGVAGLDQLPDATLPEIAFAGRSNVGKSSLINALTGRRALARVSNTPGRTQEVNLFDLGGRLCIADLPGYGYAKAPKAKVEAWTRLVFAYLRGRPSLRRVCLLIDARHGLKKADQEAIALLGEAAVSFQLILTKTDLPPRSELVQTLADIEKIVLKTRGALLQVMTTSSRTQQGLAELRAELATLALPR
ncbi:MAG: ribosome biogenesis GTP-binding protein YihA/YsxC [Pseudomonadota bacterium]